MTRATDPRTGEPTGPDYPDATPAELDAALRRADRAATELSTLPPPAIAAGLRAAADALDEATDSLAEIADRETALGSPRLAGEVGRTSGQLRMFAGVHERGEHLDAVIDRLPAGAPARDLRRMNRPVGVVAVFGASNFPFAFGVAGGDTAAALAGGCAVVAKAHPAHPGTSQAVADVVAAALARAGLPSSAFQLIHGASAEIGQTLVTHDRVAAVGFTGSTAVGRALFDLAASRPRPIPVYAEQGSLNPVVLGPSALAGDGTTAVAAQLAQAVAGGWGQFCTKPGVIVAPAELAEAFADALAAALADKPAGHLLTPGIRAAFARNVHSAADVSGVGVWRGGAAKAGLAEPATVLRTDAATFAADAALRAELFGPATVVVGAAGPDEVGLVAAAIGGSLTGTVHGDPEDPWVRAAVIAFESRVGRLIAGGVPTGVAVTPAMHHGGPYPSSTSAQHTSVGTAAVRRFLRPVAYQDFPPALLSPALADANPWRIERIVDGVRTTGPMAP